MLFYIASGGTGGHIMPALSVAQKILDRGYQLRFLGDSKSKNYLSEYKNISHSVILSSQIKRGFFQLIIALMKIAFGVVKSTLLIIFRRPDCIICFGGYATFPVGIAAILCRCKIIIHEQNAHLGKVNKIFAKFAYKIALTFPDTQGIPDICKNKIVVTGNPIRQDFIKLHNKNYSFPGFLPKKLDMKSRMGYEVLLKSDFSKIDYQRDFFKILVVGGSGGAKIFSDVLPKAFFNLNNDLKEKICIFQQCRKELVKSTFEQYRSFNINIVADYFFEDIATLIDEAHLVIARSGSSTIFEICAAKKPLIIVPFAKSSDDHQLKNAKYLEQSEAAMLIEEKDFTIGHVSNILNHVILNKAKLNELSNNIAKLAQLDADGSIVDLMEI